MTRPVSPFRRWLGVASSHPTARQLLQLPEDLQDPAAIRAAADLARRKLQQIPASEADLRRKLEAAVAAAEQELLGEQADTRADHPTPQRDLMAPFVPGMGGVTSSQGSAPDDLAPPSAVSPPAAPIAAATAPPGVASRKARRRQQSQRAVWGTLAGIVVLTALAAGGAWFAYDRGYLSLASSADKPLATDEPPSATGPHQPQTGIPKDKANSHEQDSATRPAKEADPSPKPASSASGQPESEPTPSTEQPGSNRPTEMEEDPPAADPEREPPKKPTEGTSPEPDDSPNEKPPAPGFSPQQWVKLRKHYLAARRALVDRRFDAAQKEIAAIRAMKPPRSVDGPLERLTLVEAYARQFHQRFLQALSQLESGTELKVMTQNGERLCAVVEASPEVLVIRMEGRNRRLAVRDLPPALALSIAHRVLDIKDPVTRVVDAAFLATRPDPTERERRMAIQWWREARGRGVDIGMLEEFFGDEDRLSAP